MTSFMFVALTASSILIPEQASGDPPIPQQLRVEVVAVPARLDGREPVCITARNTSMILNAISF
jgi:hypothetical protein